MSEHAVREFIEKLKCDNAMRKEVNALARPGDVCEYARERGYIFTEVEFKDVVQQNQSFFSGYEKTGVLEEDELNTVIGAGTPNCKFFWSTSQGGRRYQDFAG